MTEKARQEIQVFIAQTRGWKLRWQNKSGGDLFDVKPDGHCWEVWIPPQSWYNTHHYLDEWPHPPDYLSDLNAIHEVEVDLIIGKHDYTYNNYLDQIVGATPVQSPDSPTGPWVYNPHKARFATALQRAQACYRTLNHKS